MIRFVFATLAVLFLNSPTRADERVIGFASEVAINVDSTIDVTETISVNVEGAHIKHGIWRDFLTCYRGSQGREIDKGFDITSVKRNGQNENYALEEVLGGVRVKIGNGDVLLAYGTHTYEITYRAKKELSYFNNYDALFWNVTGGNWTLPIDKVEAIIHLPPEAKIIHHVGSTGELGSMGRDYYEKLSETSIYYAATTRQLVPGEGFVVAIAFTKGIVEQLRAQNEKFTSFCGVGFGI